MNSIVSTLQFIERAVKAWPAWRTAGLRDLERSEESQSLALRQPGVIVQGQQTAEL